MLLSFCLFSELESRTPVQKVNDSSLAAAGREYRKEQGRWFRARSSHRELTLTDRQQEELQKLQAISYVSGSQSPPLEEGVVYHDPDKVWPGYNFFTSGHAPEAFLMDMDGRIVHSWRYEFRDIWPDYDIPKGHRGHQYWRRAWLLPDGGVLAIFEGIGLIRLDRNSRLMWANACQAHHDLDFSKEGDLLVLTREAGMIPRIHPDLPILEDFISRVDSESGEEKSRISLLECFENSEEYQNFLDSEHKRRGDIFHTNTLFYLKGLLTEEDSPFTEGRVLTSMWQLNCLAVVDLSRQEVVWAHRGDYRRQHDPKIVQNGNLLLFDNQWKKETTRVVEFQLPGMQVAWRYIGTEQDPFFSRTNGAAERLPNGNTLITESDFGRAFEVTFEKEIVWEFYNPHRAGPGNEFIAVLPEVIRIPKEYVSSWLEVDAGE